MKTASADWEGMGVTEAQIDPLVQWACPLVDGCGEVVSVKKNIEE